MNYEESIKYLLRFTDYERISRAGVVWDTKRVERLLEKLDNPQWFAKTAHVAGTKGKGSTSAMISSILKEAGYKVGLYTSPHLLSYTERIRVNGQPITEAEWAGLVEQIRPHVEAVNAEKTYGELTTFELYTAMAFLHFRNIGAQYQVMEVGLGGRLDATNVVKPQVCVITSISYDHMEVLGNTLAKIATEKAGIVKPGVPVVSAPQFPEAMEAIEKICRERQAQLTKVGQDVSWKTVKFDEKGQTFHFKGLLREYDLQIPLLGEHQVENAACAVAAAELLEGMGAGKVKQSIAKGLQKVDWPGRLQVLRKKPRLAVDGAHNVYSMQKLGEALKKYFKYDRLILVLGFSADKDVAGMLDETVKMTKDIIVAASTSPRSAKPAALVEELSKRGVKARAADSVPAALKLALSLAQPNDLICASGSIFLVAEVMEQYKGQGYRE
jgi:dihydrofolate synthase / folylpolyglutamate synthase